ncbi:aminopeptidase N-like [Gigantopelta aegis]|uniref:aminopeptidase N-like n=1 Tax=Gigantopelta aegis TaxID=1735272 RepID=UPI001B887E8E|nr:aminopeptidase N-like [Gigantopelta aegis]
MGYEYDVSGSRKEGCHVTTAVGFVLVLLAILISVGVGIIVHFAGGSQDVICKCSAVDGTVPSDSGKLLAECKKQVINGETGVCAVCPGGAGTTSTTAPPTSTKAPDSKRDNLRLPLKVYPLEYDVEWKPDIYQADPSRFTNQGFVRIKMECRNATDHVTLHINGITIDNSTLVFRADTRTAEAPTITSYDYDQDRNFVIFRLSDSLTVGGVYLIEMRFERALKDDLNGIYYSQYKKPGGEKSYVVASQFEVFTARKAFPCFDEPAVKAYFNITILRKTGKSSLSCMPLVTTEDRGGGWFADVFQKTPLMSTYLLAVVVSDFTYKSQTTNNNVTYRVWARPDAVSQTEFALQVGVKCLDNYADFFGIRYPLPKQDMVALQDFDAGAMENWGLILYREVLLMFQSGVSSEGDREDIARSVAHEVGHMWFGNLVSPAWWDDLWLNEGFATFMEFYGVNLIYPQWNIFEGFVVTRMHPVMVKDSLVTSHPLYVPGNDVDKIFSNFDSISYDKGAAVIRMMRHFLGDETFKRGMSRYLKNLSFGVANHNDLWSAITEQANGDNHSIDIKKIMDTWTIQMGLPVVMVTRESGNRIRLSQQRFLANSNSTDPGNFQSPFGYKWEIPFTMTSNHDNDFSKTANDVIWIPQNADVSFDASTLLPNGGNNDSWLVGNVMQYGYYRVNYDSSNWRALLKQLNTDHEKIHPLNRAQIINDAWNLAGAGMLPMETAFQTVDYLHKEMNYFARIAAVNQLEHVQTMLMKTSLYGNFQRFMRNKVREPFRVMGMNNTGASHLDSFLRSNIVTSACENDLPECDQEAIGLYRAWMTTPSNNSIDPGLRSSVYCTALRRGGLEEWDFAFQQYTLTTVPTEKSRLLQVLSCTTQPWILLRFLERALAMSGIRRQDTLYVVGSVAQTEVGNSLAWDFFKTNFKVIIADFGASPFGIPFMISKITEMFNTQRQLDEVKQFMKREPDLGSARGHLKVALEKIMNNIGWMEKNLDLLKTWLK